MTLTRVSRVELFCKNVIRVTIFLNVTRVESESPKIVTRVESLTRVTLSLGFRIFILHFGMKHTVVIGA